MPNIPGADARQSRTLESLSRFNPAGIEALACVGLALLDCVNSNRLVFNDDQLDHTTAISTWRMVDSLYDVQDALHGTSGKLPAALAALAAFLSTVEGANHG